MHDMITNIIIIYLNIELMPVIITHPDTFILHISQVIFLYIPNYNLFLTFYLHQLYFLSLIPSKDQSTGT